MMERKINLVLNGFRYQARQNTDTGELTIDSHEKYTVLNKAAAYVKAEASKVTSAPLSLSVIEDRRSACSSCDGCDKKADGEWYCDKCGCPKWDRSRLQVKWEMPAASCPLGKWPDVG